eukprot:346271_1
MANMDFLLRHSRTLGYHNHDEHAVWEFYCKQPECPTIMEATVSLSGYRTNAPTCDIIVEFFNEITKNSNKPKEEIFCSHWEHNREGTLTLIDQEKYGHNTPMVEWDQDKADNINGEKWLFCNTSGSLNNMKQAQNLRYFLCKLQNVVG